MDSKTRDLEWGKTSKNTEEYIESLASDYHTHRVRVINSMIPKNSLSDNASIYDFGCGEGLFFQQFLDCGGIVAGSDISPKMIEHARNRRSKKHPSNKPNLSVGGVEQLKSVPSDSVNGVLALNVIAYLDDKDEELFYSEVSRILKPEEGWLLLTHSNILFDLFSLNRYTSAFISEHLCLDPITGLQISSLLSHHDHPKGKKATTFSQRENPLNFFMKLAKFGLVEKRQEFINRHEAPPAIIQNQKYPDTLNYPENERWKLYFTCSTFSSLSFLKEQSSGHS